MGKPTPHPYRGLDDHSQPPTHPLRIHPPTLVAVYRPVSSRLELISTASEYDGEPIRKGTRADSHAYCIDSNANSIESQSRICILLKAMKEITLNLYKYFYILLM